ncbi:hypothetical protein AIIKEEIJ_02372 [Rhodococcus sp. YH1]|nr:hypothetical protein [Rhodococcus sp. YH1]
MRFGCIGFGLDLMFRVGPLRILLRISRCRFYGWRNATALDGSGVETLGDERRNGVVARGGLQAA